MKMQDDNNNGRVNDSFISVMIGENGVGKSRMLSSIEKIFIELDSCINRDYSNKETKISDFEIQYIYDKDIYRAIKKDMELSLFKNEIILKKKEYNNFKLPNSILCCAFYLNDRFTFRKSDEGLIKYLGVKITPTMTNSSSVTKKISNNLLECINNGDRLRLLRKCFEFLNLRSQVSIQYDIKHRKKFFDCNNPITYENIIDIIENDLWRGRKKNSAFGKGLFEDVKKDSNLLRRVVEQINEIAKYFYRSKQITLNIDLEYNNIVFPFRFDKEAIEILIRLDILSNPNTIVYKESGYDLTKGSSGEVHFLFLFSNIIINLKENSLILIDEPEVSLHPSWQIRIIEQLRYIISESKMCCHIIIATHSHFIITDLEKSSSSLHILRKEENNKVIKCENVSKNTYGWSAENILYNVFGVPTNRNYYLAKEIDEILSDISRGNFNKVNNKKEELSKISNNLLESDPLRIIIDKIIKRTDGGVK